ncbi:MAG: hypothetical protein OEQ53_16755 [Saprospiraceae bacterium]|nr:hypothetical protein [Saprospiraceae bacterium]
MKKILMVFLFLYQSALADDVIQIPILPCQIEGSPTFDKDGVAVGEAEKSLLRRVQRANELWLPQAEIEFFVPWSIRRGPFSGIPINDPQPPPEGNGKLGDIDPQGFEGSAVIAQCEKEWSEIEEIIDENISGHALINMRFTLSSEGGVAELKRPCGFWGDICQDPSQLGVNDGVAMIVIDDECWTGNNVCFENIVTQSELEVILPHELGHSLYLGHGNGLDDDNDGIFDSCCDDEPDTDITNLMTGTGVNSQSTQITSEQRERARAFARLVPGARIVTSTGIINADVIADYQVDSVSETTNGDLDLVWVSFAKNNATKLVTVSHKLLGQIPRSGEYKFVGFFDLDENIATGGSSKDLGFSTGFRGSEFVTEVTITHVVGLSDMIQKVHGRAWVYHGSDFAEITPHPMIKARVVQYHEIETNNRVFDRVSIDVPLEFLGNIEPKLRMQAYADQLNQSRRIDYLPDEGKESAVTLRIIPPEINTCSVLVKQERTEMQVNIEGKGFKSNGEAVILLDDKLITTVKVGAHGRFNVPIKIGKKSTNEFHVVKVRTESVYEPTLGSPTCSLNTEFKQSL